MALREIIVWPAPRLKQKAKPVGEVDAAVRKICDDMAETMYSATGVGVAAPQVGVLQNIIVMDVEQRPAQEGEEREQKKKGEGLFWLIDPVLKVAEGEFTYTEGCLSIPDEYEEVTRFGHIVCEFTGRDGKRRQLEAKNTLLSVCGQHEMDPLQGRLFVDHLHAPKPERILWRSNKLTA